MPRLTKRTIDAAKTSSKEYILWDEELKGFGLRVKPSGAKTFVIQYRNSEARSRRHAVGRYGVLTPEQARKEARILLADVARGADPAETRQQARGAITIAALCREYLIKAERGVILTRRGDAKSATTLSTDRGRVERHIIPLLGHRTVKDLTQADVRRFMQHVMAGKTAADVKTKKRGRAIVKGGRGTAARTMGLFGGILTYAVNEGYRPDNPAKGIVRPRDGSRHWRLDDAGYRLLGQCLDTAEAKGEHWQRVLAARAAALTGCRLDEIEGLQKSEIDRAGMALRLESTKTGRSIRPIGSAALAVLEAACAKSDSKYVFPAISDDKKHHTGLTRWLKRVAGQAVPGISCHGLRHSFSSIADDLEYSVPTIKALIGHSRASVTEGYIHKIDKALVAAADAISGHIAALMAGAGNQPSSP